MNALQSFKKQQSPNLACAHASIRRQLHYIALTSQHSANECNETPDTLLETVSHQVPRSGLHMARLLDGPRVTVELRLIHIQVMV
eukprot:886650-Pelagomonas_calceolata.AAC.1